jgi:hypothetical protein
MGVYRINKHKFPLCNLKDFEEHLHLNLFLGTIFGNLIRGFFLSKSTKLMQLSFLMFLLVLECQNYKKKTSF